jgi:hypothetical protein
MDSNPQRFNCKGIARGIKRHQKAFEMQMADLIEEIGHLFYGSP